MVTVPVPMQLVVESSQVGSSASPVVESKDSQRVPAQEPVLAGPPLPAAGTFAPLPAAALLPGTAPLPAAGAPVLVPLPGAVPVAGVEVAPLPGAFPAVAVELPLLAAVFA